jgi:hypothetical protein
VSTRSPCSVMDSSRRAMVNHRQGPMARAQRHLQDDAFEAAVGTMAVSFYARILRQRNVFNLVKVPSAECKNRVIDSTIYMRLQSKVESLRSKDSELGVPETVTADACNQWQKLSFYSFLVVVSHGIVKIALLAQFGEFAVLSFRIWP